MKLFLFNQYKNKVYHVVFEDFFAKRLIALGVSSERVFVIPHPVSEIKAVSTSVKYDCIGLCNSNEESFINEAISKESEFKHNNLNVLFRSKNKSPTHGSITVVKGFLQKNQYDEIMASGKTVLVPLPTSYIYRLSGSIYDALARRKLVLTTSMFYVKEYGRRYPGICFHVSTVADLIEQLVRTKESSINSEASFDKFLKEHSLESVRDSLERMLNEIINIRLHN